MSAKTATYVRLLPMWRGDAALYRLSEPMRYGKSAVCDHVIVSAVVAYGEPETYIFPASAESKNDPVSWGELDGSIRGVLSHAEALAGAGYEIVGRP